jgi:hypothetical protein
MRNLIASSVRVREVGTPATTNVEMFFVEIKMGIESSAVR